MGIILGIGILLIIIGIVSSLGREIRTIKYNGKKIKIVKPRNLQQSLIIHTASATNYNLPTSKKYISILLENSIKEVYDVDLTAVIREIEKESMSEGGTNTTFALTLFALENKMNYIELYQFKHFMIDMINKLGAAPISNNYTTTKGSTPYKDIPSLNYVGYSKDTSYAKPYDKEKPYSLIMLYQTKNTNKEAYEKCKKESLDSINEVYSLYKYLK